MKSICIITSEESFLTNFGAALQGVALYKVLEKNGYDATIQRYLGGVLRDKQKNVSMKKIFSYSPLEVYLKTLFRIGKISHKKGVNEQREIFRKFQEDYMSFYPGERKTWCTLKNDYPEADIYICGSDQIWNPTFKGGYNDPGYFLDFVKERKISYAPSFGVSDIPDTSIENLDELLSTFDCISVREKAGAEIIEKYTNRKAKVVLDPTLLIDSKEWNSMSNMPKNIPDKYILCYRFGNSLEVNKHIIELSKKLNLPIVELPLSGISYHNIKVKRLFEAGPSEFIGLIKNATLVCTDSFHATVFSILMETPFITFLRGEDTSKGEGMNSRITNLLGISQLNSRISYNLDLNDSDQIFNIDFSKAKEILEIEKNDCLEWLLNSLKEVELKYGK